jgi:hypothetical protein
MAKRLMRLWYVAVHVEIPGNLGQCDHNAFQVFVEDDLAGKPRIRLQQGSHIQPEKQLTNEKSLSCKYRG